MLKSLPVSLAILLFIGCGSNEGNKESGTTTATPDTVAKKEIKLVCKSSTDTAAAEPTADIYVSINGNETILKSGSGECHTLERTQFAASNIPEDAVMALGISRAGGGDYFYLIMKENKPVIFEGAQMITQQGASYTWKQMEMTFPE